MTTIVNHGDAASVSESQFARLNYSNANNISNVYISLSFYSDAFLFLTSTAHQSDIEMVDDSLINIGVRGSGATNWPSETLLPHRVLVHGLSAQIVLTSVCRSKNNVSRHGAL
jgi:hypothetical protein